MGIIEWLRRRSYPQEDGVMIERVIGVLNDANVEGFDLKYYKV